MNNTIEDKLQFRRELFLAIIVTGLACCAGFSELLYASNDLFPYTSDAMGHMAKVRFLAESFSRGEFPSWFPYWYNGTAVTQYYPPLSYWIMAPLFMLTENAMITFKAFCFLVMFTGGIGVWYFCRAHIGNWCGIFGSVIFCLQPYILRVLFGAGMVAQGPIIALIPWYLAAMLAFSKKQKMIDFIAGVLLCGLMIISHPNTLFMICFCIMAVAFIMVVFRQITMRCYLFMIATLIFAGILTAFWSLVGVTGLENPNLPFLLAEAPLVYTADKNWFLSLASDYFFFAIPITIGSVLAACLFIYRTLTKKTDNMEKFPVLFCSILTVFTIVFAFGLRLPFFKYLPMGETLFAGRILILTSASGSFLCAYLVYQIMNAASKKKVGIRILAVILGIFMMATTLFYMNPLQKEYDLIVGNDFEKMLAEASVEETDNFEKGRYSSVGSSDCSETYFSLLQDYNSTDGWNIEGTTQQVALRNFMLAISTNNLEFVAKNLAFWNVRFTLIDNSYGEIAEALNENYHFTLKTARGGKSFYTSDDPSSYFMVDNRNALIFGPGASGVAIPFPYLVYDSRNDISEYSLTELEKYKLIYLCEPRVETAQEKENIEKTVKELLKKGIVVFIEPRATTRFDLFNVSTSDMLIEKNPVIEKQKGAKIETKTEKIVLDKETEYSRNLFGLDQSYYKLVQNDGMLKNDILGTKKVGNGEVVFIGMHLSQFLKPVYVRNWGAQDEDGYPGCTSEVELLFEDLFKTYRVSKEFWPEPFSVMQAEWNYKGVDFEYEKPKNQEMTLSITYAPRWKATIDGKPFEIGQRENLITMDLPAGKHKVKLVYGLTKYGIAGYAISLLGLIAFFFFLRFYDIIYSNFTKKYKKLLAKLQINTLDPER
ncbi:MAG: 6-pyruvoyl-tetrahydropterin synthase-related protein [Eubacteriales bacterium]|nr:6-pyruvoyl-tetrahydropterin synthase-related protein [Eubacteriales bacterium]MDD3349727.1 6-pyruvoyl-tetrahydropterin synthase-related protein [Eubacteriales bacterium]